MSVIFVWMSLKPSGSGKVLPRSVSIHVVLLHFSQTKCRCSILCICSVWSLQALQCSCTVHRAYLPIWSGLAILWIIFFSRKELSVLYTVTLSCFVLIDFSMSPWVMVFFSFRNNSSICSLQSVTFSSWSLNISLLSFNGCVVFDVVNLL